MTLSRAGSRSQSEPSTESLGDALTALCAEVGIPFEEMLHTVEGALAIAYARAFNPSGDITVKLDTKTGGLEVRSRIVRSDGSEMVEMLPSEDFKRLAAQTAKHAVLRHIHDLERDKVLRAALETVDAACTHNECERLVVVAPGRVLTGFRKHASDKVRARLWRERASEVSALSTDDIAKSMEMYFTPGAL